MEMSVLPMSRKIVSICPHEWSPLRVYGTGATMRDRRDGSTSTFLADISPAIDPQHNAFGLGTEGGRCLRSMCYFHAFAMRLVHLGGVALLLFVSTLAVSTQAGQQPTRATPIDAVTAIVDAFRSHDVIALGKGPHGNVPGHRFRLSLVRDPRFAATVDDVLVEFGRGRQRAVMDRFVNGEDIPYDTLRRVWEDTTIANPTWERPIYREFFEAIRLVACTD